MIHRCNGCKGNVDTDDDYEAHEVRDEQGTRWIYWHPICLDTARTKAQKAPCVQGIQGSWSGAKIPLVQVRGVTMPNFQTCYVCERQIETETERDFSSVVRNGERFFYHLGCAQEGDPKTYDEFINAESLYLLSVA